MSDPVASSPQPDRVFDITPPNRTAPSSTSRPLIANNQLPEPDPMMRPTSNVPLDTTNPTPPPAPLESPPETPQPLPTPPPTSVSPLVTDSSADEPQNQEFSQSVSSIAGDISSPKETETSPPQPQVMASSVVVVRHRISRPSTRSLLLVVIGLLLIVSAVDILLDDQVIKTNAIPHTHFFQK